MARSDLATDRVRVPAVEEAGFRVARVRVAPSVLVVTTGDAALRLHASERARARVRIAGNEAFVEAAGIDGIVFERESGAALSLFVKETEIILRPIFRRIPVETPPLVASDARAWARATGDPWVEAEVADALAREGALAAAIAAGIVARFRPLPPAREARRASVESILAGRPEPEEAAPERAWVRALSEEARGAIERLGLAAADLLAGELDALGAEPRENDPAWRAGMAAVFRERDDLEGVRVLLAEAGAGASLARALARVDALGRELLRALPRWAGAGKDERLRRAVAINPEGWWTIPVDWEG
jgi:hypothetical protein